MSKLTTNDFAFAIVTSTAEAVNIAQGLINDARLLAEAKAEAERHTDCRSCQAGMENYLLANAGATFTEKEAAHREVWEQCHDCQVEYEAWLSECHQRLNADLLDCHCYNGDDERWQNGGA